MPPVIPDAPWWANALLILLAMLITATVSITVAVVTTRRKLTAIADDTKATRHQVQNSHQTNLRDDVDGLDRKLERQGRHIRDLDASVRAVTHSMDRRLELQQEALEAAIEDRKRETAAAISAALDGHVADCPLRNPQPSKED